MNNLHTSSSHILLFGEKLEELNSIREIAFSTVFSISYLLFGFAVLPLPRLLLDVSDHGKGCPVVAVSKVDDIGDGGQHGPLAAGANRGVPLTHCQQQLPRGEVTRVFEHTFYCRTWKKALLSFNI